MKKLTKIAILSTIVVSLSFTFAISEPQIKERPIPKKIEVKIVQLLQKFVYETPSDIQMIKKAKLAGANFLPEMLIDPSKADYYQTEKAQNEMIGIYHADLCYASIFGKKDETQKIAKAIRLLTIKRGYDTKEFSVALQKLMKDSQYQTTEIFFTQFEEMVNKNSSKFFESKKNYDAAINVAYSSLIELTYILTKMTIISNYDPRFISLVNMNFQAFSIIKDMIDLYKFNPKLNELVNNHNRRQVMDQLLSIINKKQISQNDIKKVNDIVAKERQKIVNQENK